MNVSERARGRLGPGAPGRTTRSSPAPEMAERVLEPLARTAGARRPRARRPPGGRRRPRAPDPPRPAGPSPARASARSGCSWRRPEGEEVLEADAVLDASGVYGQPAALGAGGIPAPGRARAERRAHPPPGRRSSERLPRAGRPRRAAGRATATRPRTRWPCSRRAEPRRASPGPPARPTAGRAWRWRTTRCPSAQRVTRGRQRPGRRRRRRS